jgi:hypothetical protein
MPARTILALLIAVALTPARAAIELPPVPHESTEEGFTYQKLLFKDGKRQVVYQLPPKWTFRAREAGVQLTPPNAPFAEAVILAAPQPGLPRLDEKGIEEGKQEFLRTLPPGAQLVSIVSEQSNPVLLDNKPSYEVIASYQLMGEKFVRSALFTNFADMQVSFRLTARKSDFEKLHQTFRFSILTWHWEDRPNAPDAGPLTASK